MWIWFALLSAVFAALTSILAKIGIEGVDSTLATAIRTVVVLVNGNSASAAEILAGAIQDTGRGELIGTTTFGKGLVQRLFTLPDGSGLNVTIQKYYTPNGTSIHGVGITPDYEVELPEEYAQQTNIPAEADTQLQKAVEVLSEKNI